MMSFRFKPDLIHRLDSWRSAQDVEPARTAVIEKAIEEFLDRRNVPHREPEAAAQDGKKRRED